MLQEQAAERIRQSREDGVEDAAKVMRLAAKAGVNLRKTGGLTMTGLLSCASHSEHDEWMHWMLKHQGRNFKRFSKSHAGALTEPDIAESMHAFEEEKYEAEEAANDGDPTTFADESASEVPRQRALEQALKFKADTQLDRLLLSVWKGEVDEALGLLGNLPSTIGSEDAEAKESVLASPIFANPRGLSTVRASKLSHQSAQYLARLAQPTARANLDEQFQAASKRVASPTPQQMMDQVRSGELTMAQYKVLRENYERRQCQREAYEKRQLASPVPTEGHISPGPVSRRPRSAPPGRDRFARDLEAAAAACWAGDEIVAREYTRGLPAIGLARVVRRVKGDTVARLLSGSSRQSIDVRVSDTRVDIRGPQQKQNAEEQADVQKHTDEQYQVFENLKAAIGTGTTLLHIAAAKGHANVVAALLSPLHKDGRPNPDGLAHVNAQNEQGCSALLAAVMASSSVSAEQLQNVVSALISAGADVNASGSYGVSALQIAAADGHVGVVQSLLGAGAAVNDAWDGGATALLLAAQHGHLEVCVLLILAGADVLCSDADGLTPLMAAAMSGHEAVAAELLRHATEKIASRTGRAAQPI